MSVAADGSTESSASDEVGGGVIYLTGPDLEFVPRYLVGRLARQGVGKSFQRGRRRRRDAECERLAAAGYQVKGPTQFPWGRSAYLYDPDGRMVELHGPDTVYV